MVWRFIVDGNSDIFLVLTMEEIMEEPTGIDKELAVLRCTIDFHNTSSILLEEISKENFEFSTTAKAGIIYHLEASSSMHLCVIHFKEERDRWRMSAILLGIGFILAILISVFM